MAVFIDAHRMVGVESTSSILQSIGKKTLKAFKDKNKKANSLSRGQTTTTDEYKAMRMNLVEPIALLHYVQRHAHTCGIALAFIFNTYCLLPRRLQL